MKKNFIKVSVICALTLASSATMVSCSDYDDDIKNHQEQIDALKKQLDASKTEITEGLNTAIEGLKAQIEEVAGSKADAASVQALEQKAAELQQALDSKASSDQIASLSTEVKGLIDDVNKELTAAMQDTKTSLEGQISTLETKQEELNKKLESLNGTSEQIASIQTELDKVSADLIEAKDQLKTITDAKYGDQIAELQTSITKLEGLKTEVESYTDEQINTLHITITGEIQAAIEEAMTQVSTETAAQLKTLDDKFKNYATQNQLQEVTKLVNDLYTFKDETLTGLLNDKASVEELAKANENIEDLKDQLTQAINDNDESISSINEAIAGIKTSVDNLRKEITNILGIMVQSIMYVPTYENVSTGNGFFTRVAPVRFNNLYIYDKNWQNKKLVAENTTNEISFRVTPATAATMDFLDNYEIAFEGQLVDMNVRSSLPSYLTVNKVVSADPSTGIIKLSVQRNSNGNNTFKENCSYTLCAHLVPKTKEGVTDPTNISSNFFLANHKQVEINHIKYTTTVAEGAKMEWNDNKASKSIVSGVQLVGYKKTSSSTTAVSGAEDLEATFGKVFTITYAMKSSNSPFNISADGTVSVKNPTNGSDRIGDSDYPVATVAPTQYPGYTTSTELTNLKFEIIKDQIKYEKTINPTWNDVATNAHEYTFDYAEIARTFSMSIDDLKNLRYTIDETQLQATSGNVTTTLNDTEEKLVVRFSRYTNVNAGTITIKFNDAAGSGTTQSAREYTITLNVSKTSYPTSLTLPTHQAEVWDGQNVFITPTFTKDGSNKISAMNLKIGDIRNVYKDFANIVTNLKNNNGVYTSVIADAYGVPGVTSTINYNNNPANSQNDLDLAINNGTYNGAAIPGTTTFTYASGIKASSEAFNIKVVNVSGTFTVDAQSKEIRMSSKTERKQPKDLTWKDYQNRTIWKNGVINPDAIFAVSPFDDAIYAMDAPVFSLADTKFLNVNANTGVITFKNPGSELNFAQDYKTTLTIKIAKPKWGPIAITNGVAGSSSDNNYYYLTFDVVIPAGTY